MNHAPAETDRHRHRIRNIVGGSAGNMVEWYDWYIYAAFSLYFAPSFFAPGDTIGQLSGAALIFWVGFLMRPIGAWVMGVYSDHHGRKAGLSLSVGLMCFGSLLIAFAPTYAEVGALAPATLVVARLIQGLSLGGEYGSSATYLSEVAGRQRRGFYSSFQYVTLISGQLTASAVLLILQFSMSEPALESWGWRIPFAIGAVLALVVFYIRRRLTETASFENARAAGAPKSGGLRLIREHPKEAGLVVALTAGGTLAFYAFTIYLPKFLVTTSGFDRQVAAQVATAAILVFMCIQPLIGAWSDRIGRKPVMAAFGILGVALTVPVFTLLEGVRDPLAAFGLMMVLLVALSGYTSINAVVKAELFPAHIRALGVALPYALANAIFGGSAEWVAFQLKNAGIERAFYWYVTAMIGVSLVVYLRMRDTKHHSRIEED